EAFDVLAELPAFLGDLDERLASVQCGNGSGDEPVCLELRECSRDDARLHQEALRKLGRRRTLSCEASRAELPKNRGLPEANATIWRFEVSGRRCPKTELRQGCHDLVGDMR